MKMSIKASACALIAGVLSAAAGNACASVTLDQSNLPGQNFYNPLGPTFVPGQNTAEVSQVFTVGLAGVLTTVSVDLLVPGGGFFTLSVVPVVAGVPDTTGAPLASVTQGLGAGQAFYDFDVSSANLVVSPGQVLAYWLTGDFSRWIGPAGDTYGGGAAFWRFPGAIDGSPTDWAQLPYDAYFQTFVDVPAPASTALVGLGGLLAARRRRA